jgi:hypothetical protein
MSVVSFFSIWIHYFCSTVCCFVLQRTPSIFIFWLKRNQCFCRDHFVKSWAVLYDTGTREASETSLLQEKTSLLRITAPSEISKYLSKDEGNFSILVPSPCLRDYLWIGCFSYMSCLDEKKPYTYVFLANLVPTLADESNALAFPCNLIFSILLILKELTSMALSYYSAA